MEDRSLAEVIRASTFLLPFLEVANILVLVKILKTSLTMWQIIDELSGVATSISIDHSSLAMFMIVMKRSDVVILADLVDMIPIPLSHSIVPLPLVQLLFTIVNTIAMFKVILPSTIIISHPVIIKVDPSTLHDSIIDQPIEDLSIGKDIDPLSMEDIIFPRSKVNIPTLICINALTFS